MRDERRRDEMPARHADCRYRWRASGTKNSLQWWHLRCPTGVMPRTVLRHSVRDNLSLAPPHSVHEGRKSIGPKKNFSGGSARRNSTEEDLTFKPPEEDEFHPATDTLRKAGGELEKLWLVVDWPADAAEPYHYYLAHLHRPPTKARCLTLSRSRWHIEQYFQRAKDDLGFDHCEGRSWTGFHHHLVLSALAYLFILAVHARAKKTSGATWEQTLRAIQPWLVRSTGSCICCGSKFDDIVVVIT